MSSREEAATAGVVVVGLALSLCWLGIGLWVLADTQRLQRVGGKRLHAALLRTGWLVRGGWCLRCGAAALLLTAALPLVRVAGGALGGVTLLLTLMAVLSVAVLSFPLRPRLYAASVALSGVLVLLSVVGG